MGLAENTSQRSDRDLVLPRHNGGVHDLARPPCEFDVAALLAGFNETNRFKPSLDFTEGLGLKPPQPQP